MNSLALHLGALGSHFATPHGLDTPGNSAIAADLATIGAELLTRRRLARIVGTERRQVGLTDGSEVVKNSNPLLRTYRGAVGIKTGFTDRAGRCWRRRAGTDEASSSWRWDHEMPPPIP